MANNTKLKKIDLAKAPQPSVDRIEELASRILSGDILLPKFQRDFVWEKSQIIDMWDSIAKNYPVGSVLLWRSKEKLQSEKNIADLEIANTKEGYPVNYLLDGQQRLSSVCGALYWDGNDSDSRWNIAYDLRAKRFVHLDFLDDPPIHQIRLNRLPEPAKYFGHLQLLSSESDGAAMFQAATDLFNRFKDYKIATVTLLEMPINDVAPIFERINSRGTRLTIVDLMRAATWSDNFDLMDAIQQILDDISGKGFGEIDKKAVLRSLSAAAGGGFSEGSIDNLRRYSADDLKVASQITKDAYKMAIDFLSTELSIPTDKQIPYVNQIVVLAEIFRLLPKPNASQHVQIKRWFWKTAVSGYFGGWNTGNMASDQESAKNFAAGSVTQLNSVVSNPGKTIWINQQFRSNTAHAKILSLLLAFNKPIDLLTGQSIDVDKALHQSNSKEFHHFFPRDWLLKSGVSQKRANALANFVMLTASSNKIITNRAPSDYLAEVSNELGGRLKDALSANLISDAAYAAALNDDYETFVNERAQTITEKVKELTGW